MGKPIQSQPKRQYNHVSLFGGFAAFGLQLPTPGGAPGRRTVKNQKRSQVAETWLEVTLKLGGLVAVFSGMAGALVVLLSSAGRP